MKLNKVVWSVAVAMVMMLTVSTAKAAAGDDSPGILMPVEKLSRGIANVAFGPMELLYKGYDVTQAQGGVAGITWGPLKGLCYVVAREVVGVVEIATFLFPLPGCPNDPNDVGWGYGPIMQPEWVVDPQHDWGNFVFDETAIVPQSY
ncbi:MAG: exosortase system-associated protein, TIGR04073 family [Victivallaceae bacterium]|nr:exosortase system-associated protein, TIGR04073 family [Victivallaceae bacterium]